MPGAQTGVLAPVEAALLFGASGAITAIRADSRPLVGPYLDGVTAVPAIYILRIRLFKFL